MEEADAISDGTYDSDSHSNPARGVKRPSLDFSEPKPARAVKVALKNDSTDVKASVREDEVDVQVTSKSASSSTD